jgi:hypothetical protein
LLSPISNYSFYLLVRYQLHPGRMDINDFKDNFKYKLFIPFIYIINWALMFVGPTFIQVQYQKICILALTYLCLKSTVMVFIAIVATYKSYRLFGRA